MAGTLSLAPGQKVHQVIAALVRDFYTPTNVGMLFSELYPDDYFDINSSPKRVRQHLCRVREWLTENKIPARIHHDQGTYRFVINGSFGIRIPLENSRVDSAEIKWQKLKETFAEGVQFSAKQACTQLKWSRSNFFRLAESQLKTGQLLKLGSGTKTVYMVAPASQAQKTSAA